MIFDGSILDQEEIHSLIREDLQYDKIEYIFPEGMNQIDIFDECRALSCLDDFDTIFSLSMQLLNDKMVIITIKNIDGSKTELCKIKIEGYGKALRNNEAINSWPCLIVWLTKHISIYVSKKISEAFEQSAASTGSGEEDGRRKDPYNNEGEVQGDGNYLVTKYFGDALLYACYEFYDRFKNKPANWFELFDFLRFMKVKSIQRELAMAAARIGQDG